LAPDIFRLPGFIGPVPPPLSIRVFNCNNTIYTLLDVNDYILFFPFVKQNFLPARSFSGFPYSAPEGENGK
jgi:hypothetical protein